MPKYLPVTWGEVYEATARIAASIKIKGEGFDAVLGIARGGWVPARLLSDFLSVRRLVSVQIESYDNEVKGSLRLLEDVPAELIDSRLLLVDDISDSGSSLIAIIDALRRSGATKFRTATLYTKPWSKLVPDYFFKEVSEWVVFPWELVETLSPKAKPGADVSRLGSEIGVDAGLTGLVEMVLDAKGKSRE